MKRFIESEDRNQGMLLPEQLDDYVTEDNPVRVVDVFVEQLDLARLGFEGVDPSVTGRPAYHPAVPNLRIYRIFLRFYTAWVDSFYETSLVIGLRISRLS